MSGRGAILRLRPRPRHSARKTSGVLIAPNLVKAGLIIGGQEVVGRVRAEG